ncbi:MAG TPA: FG-GAP-like repeat-containing protein [Cyclobacteriaceae bacterium]|nr:FG-GAP-like repeat-containing protein [Cyclobacteriaceae bacterium]
MTLRLLLFVLCLPMMVAAQTFTDVTPGGIPALESGDIAWADYNNDGYLDFAIIGKSGTGNFGGIYTGAGNGTFQLLLNSNMPKMRTGDIDWGDFDHDGDLDLAMIGSIDATPWFVTVIMRNNITSFEQYFTTEGSEGGSLTWFDYDNDGDLDLYQVGAFFVNPYPNSVFINSDGQFSTEDVFHVKGYYSELEIDLTACIATDFDNDGDQDIFSSGKYSHGVWNEASLLVNNGDMSIENTDKYRFSYHDVAIRTGSINQGDFNRDGLMDYFLTGNSSSISGKDTPFSQMLFGTGDGNFARRGKLLDVYNSSSDVGDIDNDGDLDIIVSGQASAGALTRIYLNNGSGSFNDAGITNLVGLSLCSVTLADYDNDGDLDVFITGRDQANVKTTKLYRNNLRSNALAPNEKPTPPSNLRFRMENNTVTLEWESGSDKETPTGSLTYNVYVALESKKPFKLFPQAIVETGKRKVYDQGNTSVNTRWTLKGLKTGTYYFSVQSIDGANMGSEFAAEVSFKYIRIDSVGSTCPNSEQVFSVSPANSYNWTISGGKIVEGQGSEMIRVKWDEQPISPQITASTDGSSNSFMPYVQTLPPAVIVGAATVCDMEAYTEYRPASYSQDLSYNWNIDGFEFTTAVPSFEWASPGNKLVTLSTTDLNTGCKNSDTIHVAVAERILVEVNYDNGVYTSENTDASYAYKWEGYINNDWSTVSTAENFTPTFAGLYRLTITNQYDCSYVNNFYVDEIITGLEEQAERLQLAPNPAVTSFRIVNLPPTSKPVNVSVIDMAGRTMFATSTTEDTDINCSSLHRGVYVVVIRSGDNVNYSKIVIE